MPGRRRVRERWGCRGVVGSSLVGGPARYRGFSATARASDPISHTIIIPAPRRFGLVQGLLPSRAPQPPGLRTIALCWTSRPLRRPRPSGRASAHFLAGLCMLLGSSSAPPLRGHLTVVDVLGRGLRVLAALALLLTLPASSGAQPPTYKEAVNGWFVFTNPANPTYETLKVRITVTSRYAGPGVVQRLLVSPGTYRESSIELVGTYVIEGADWSTEWTVEAVVDGHKPLRCGEAGYWNSLKLSVLTLGGASRDELDCTSPNRSADASPAAAAGRGPHGLAVPRQGQQRHRGVWDPGVVRRRRCASCAPRGGRRALRGLRGRRLAG